MCWYRQIEETNPITKANWREKPCYLIDIAIREKHSASPSRARSAVSTPAAGSAGTDGALNT